MFFDSEAIELNNIEIEALSESIVQFHDEIVARTAAYHPQESSLEYAKTLGKVSSIICCVYLPHYGRMRCETLFEQSCVLACKLASSHIFPDGNKRTAFRVLDALIKKNYTKKLLGDLLSNEEAEAYAIRMAKANNTSKEDEICEELKQILMK